MKITEVIRPANDNFSDEDEDVAKDLFKIGPSTNTEKYERAVGNQRFRNKFKKEILELIKDGRWERLPETMKENHFYNKAGFRSVEEAENWIRDNT